VFFRDLLVASVACGLGLSMIQVALLNQGWWFENFLIRQIETNRGRAAARKALGLGGSIMILIGAWTMLAPWLKSGENETTIRYARPLKFENRPR
jgi:hypothetical protein